MSRIAELIATDQWSGTKLESQVGPAILRFRTPVLSSPVTQSHPNCFRVIWPYAPEGSGALPDDATSGEMTEFEDHIIGAVEPDATAVLTAVLTFDGARQWAFYTNDVQGCIDRLNAMPAADEPYPIEIDAFPDPDWAYLRSELLAQVPFEG